METLISIATLLALLCASALCIVLIVVSLRVKDVIGNVEKDVHDVSTHAVPVLENMEYVSSRVKNISDNIDDQVLMIHESIGAIRQVADDVVALERKVQSRIEGPVLDGVAFIAALVRGFRTFFDRLRV